jgi:phosphoribosyl 1,2-cyclic phosphodiesterase
VEVRCGGRLLILDAGTGLRRLGAALQRGRSAIDADIFVTHCHIDHVLGLPYFAPAHVARNRFRLWFGQVSPTRTLAAGLHQLMSAPLFPTPLGSLKAHLRFNDFPCGDTLTPHPGIVVRTAPLHHPDGATGYRIEHAGKAVAYVTDTEHRPGIADANVLLLAERADLMIYDATYTEDEYPAHVGWGHSTWEEGVRLAEAAHVRTLALFHHAPEHDDTFMDAVAAQAAGKRPSTIVAREGDCLTL